MVVRALCLWTTTLSIDDLPECLAFGSRMTAMDEPKITIFAIPSEIKDCIQDNEKHMHKERKETTHVRDR